MPKSDHFEPEDAFVAILTLIKNQRRQSSSHIKDHGALGVILEDFHEGDDPCSILLEGSNKLQRNIDGHKDINHNFVAHACIFFVGQRIPTMRNENLIPRLPTQIECNM